MTVSASVCLDDGTGRIKFSVTQQKKLGSCFTWLFVGVCLNKILSMVQPLVFRSVCSGICVAGVCVCVCFRYMFCFNGKVTS